MPERKVAQRIVIVLPDLRLGGAQRVLLQLAAQFAAQGRHIVIVSLLDDGPLRQPWPAGVGYHPLLPALAGGGPRLVLQGLPRLMAYLRKLRPDAVLSSMSGANLLCALACTGLRCRLVLREAAALINVPSHIQRCLMRVLYRRADVLLAVSAGVARDLASLGLDDGQITVIPNPVDVAHLRLLATRHASFCVAAPYVMAIGRLVPQKDHATLLAAYAGSSLRHTHRLLIVGEGSERTRLEALARTLGIADRTDLPGAVPLPYAQLMGAALLVLSSRWEGYPNVLLEALALDVPVVSTDCPSGPRELLRQGRYGRLVAIGDAPALACAMEAAIREPCEDPSPLLDAHRPDRIACAYLAVLDGRAVTEQV